METQSSLYFILDGGLQGDQEPIPRALNTVAARLVTLSSKPYPLLMKTNFLSIKGVQQLWEADIPEV